MRLNDLIREVEDLTGRISTEIDCMSADELHAHAETWSVALGQVIAAGRILGLARDTLDGVAEDIECQHCKRFLNGEAVAA